MTRVLSNPNQIGSLFLMDLKKVHSSGYGVLVYRLYICSGALLSFILVLLKLFTSHGSVVVPEYLLTWYNAHQYITCIELKRIVPLLFCNYHT
jgi:hypothetical protein